MERALITGITGQAGSYLAELLLEEGQEVHGIVRRSSTFNTSRIDHLIEQSERKDNRFYFHWGDLTDSNSLNRIISDVEPDEIYNLGAMSHVKVSFDVPEFTARVDGLGPLLILDIIKSRYPYIKFLQSSTSEMFGGVPKEVPPDGYNEKSPLNPQSPYAAAKVYAYHITKMYREAYNLFASNYIAFNFESPRRGETFVTRKITRWLGKYLKGKTNIPLQLGNIHARRDWGHAKDYVNAFYLIMQQNEPGDYVIATGQEHSVKDFVDKCFAYVNKLIVWSVDDNGLDYATYDDDLVVEVSPRLFRPLDAEVLRGNSTKIREKLLWKPEYNIDSLVAEMVEEDIKLA